MSDKNKRKKGGRPPDRSRKSGSNQKALEDANNALQREIDQLKARMREMESRRAQVGAQDEGEPQRQIPKPKGSPGNGYSLREEMGLGGEEDKLEYNKILRGVKRIAGNQGIDWDHDFKDHPLDVLRNTYKVARAVYPILSNFENDWATAAIIQQAGISIRKYEVAKGELPTRAERVAKRRPTEPATATSSKRRRLNPPVAIEAENTRAQARREKDREGSKSTDDEDEDAEQEGLSSGAE
ncbi:hypothetical protein FOMPIDRAFT_1051674 [Fomitopsis schrenkii]|uniref:Uncharacterized protein n=1 Tax=Fomitopsis schrenkii TaxID=2126942 RepID=S8DZ80_FOMSC|nr:hypothetical protein FOMPIDRAFT_1051674 [Fomitopsis schrenkii]